MPDQAPYRIKDSRFRPQEHSQFAWFAIIEEGTPYEALFDPQFWDFVKEKLQPTHMIRVFPDEGTYMADLVVRAIGVGGVKVGEYYRKVFDDAAEMPASLLSQYRVKYAGPHHKYRVERISDGHVVQPGFSTEGEANTWLSANVKSLEIKVPEAA